MTSAQRVGQLFMVGTPATGLSSTAADAVLTRHTGSVILTGRSSAGTTATAGVTASLRSLAARPTTGGAGMLVATDQEGGRVQVLSGPGYSAIPTALVQGTYATSTLRTDAGFWGRYRGDLGFNGVVISDDLGAARQVATVPPSSRGMGVVVAGGDMALTVDPRQLPAMYDAALARAATDPAFAAQVDAAVVRVLRAKQARGLLPAPLLTSYYLDDGIDGSPEHLLSFGEPPDQTFVGDWDGDGRDTIGVRVGNRFLLADGDGGAPTSSFVLGQPGDEAYVGDFDGNGTDTIALRHGRRVSIRATLTGPVVTSFDLGEAYEQLLVGGWGPGGSDTFGVRQGNTVQVESRLGARPVRTVSLGRATDDLLVGDWDGNGTATLAAHRGNTWYLTSALGGPATTVLTYGRATDLPLVGDWNGDRRDTPGVRR